MVRSIISLVGGLYMDIILETERMPDIGESMPCTSLAHYPGGKAANTSIAIYRASHTKPINEYVDAGTEGEGNISKNIDDSGEMGVFMNGTVGDDDSGVQLKAKLQQNGIDISGVMVAEGERSGTCVVMVELGSGDSRNLGYQGANALWAPREKNSVECLAGGQTPHLIIAFLEISREQVEAVLKTAGEKGVDTLLNPSPAKHLIGPTYKHLTHLIMNETEAAMLSGLALEELSNLVASFLRREIFR